MKVFLRLLQIICFAYLFLAYVFGHYYPDKWFVALMLGTFCFQGIIGLVDEYEV